MRWEAPIPPPTHHPPGHGATKMALVGRNFELSSEQRERRRAEADCRRSTNNQVELRIKLSPNQFIMDRRHTVLTSPPVYFLFEKKTTKKSSAKSVGTDLARPRPISRKIWAPVIGEEVL